MSEELKNMMNGVSKGIVEESTEPYLEYEKWMSKLEGYIRGIKEDSNYRDKNGTNGDRNGINGYRNDYINGTNGYRNGINGTNDDINGYRNDDINGDNYIQENIDIEKEDEKIKKKNKWLK